MKPTSRSALRLLVLVTGLVLLCSSFALAVAREADSVVKRNSIVKVDASKQVSANQKFSQLWQLKGGKTLPYLIVGFPGRVFVSQSSEISSKFDAEVIVSGSSKAAVAAVDVSFDVEMALDLQLAASPNIGDFLLVEVRIRAKNSLTNIRMERDGDLVILKDVLASASLPITGDSQARRELQVDNKNASSSLPMVAASSSDLAGLVAQTEFVKNSTSTETRNSTGVLGVVKEEKAQIFSVVEEVQVPSTADGAAPARTWLIKKPESFYKGNVDLQLALPGSALVDYVSLYTSPDVYAGRVMVLGDNVDSLDQIEVVSTHGSSAETVQVQFKTKTGALMTPTGNFTTFVGFSDQFRVVPTSASGTSVQVQKNTLRISDIETEDVKLLIIENRGPGNLFISAPESLLALSFMDLTNGKNGSIQVDIGRVWMGSKINLATQGSGPINYFGDIIQAPVQPVPFESGRICVNVSRHDLFPISMLYPTLGAQVSYTGQSAKGFGSFSCEKHAVPERVPAEILVVNNKTSKELDGGYLTEGKLISASATSPLKGAVAIVVTMLFLTALTLL